MCVALSYGSGIGGDRKPRHVGSRNHYFVREGCGVGVAIMYRARSIELGHLALRFAFSFGSRAFFCEAS